jgi:methylmalonyl-CoA/ethylmalonyl-CoA epimerase
VSTPARADQAGAPAPSPLRRLDHVAIAVRDTATALEYFAGRLGLEVLHTDELDMPPVTLTYLAAGNAYIQLICPRGNGSELAGWIAEHGEGLHHICFGVDDVERDVATLSDPSLPRPQLGSGWGRLSSFVANGAPHGVILECTEIQHPVRQEQPDEG